MGTFTDHGLYRYDTVSVTSGTPSSFTIDIDPDSALSMVTLETTSTNESNNSLRIKVLDSSSFAMSVAYRMIVSGTTSTLSSSSGTTNPYLTYQYLGNLTSSFGSYESQRATLWVTNVMSGSAPYRHPQIFGFVSFAHGEGFGLPLFEAAYSGLPVVPTGWSGQLDFMVVDSGNDRV